ncbi:hemolysin III family protein [Labilibaculum sp.]|uniref:PAQR family membrane homeostasis protein TrhA n=1 Tax=Labilibaculum sp. TaxID=2060723 RepID=UPI00356420CE
MKWILLLSSWAVNEKKRFLSNQETTHELANWLSHGFGFLFGIPAGIYLLGVAYETQSLHGFIACLLFVFAFNLLYVSSSVYHYLMDSPNRKLFRKLDHISIFFMIAGTYTPFLVIYMDNLVGHVYLMILWGLVVVGVFYKIFLIGRYRWISLLLYLFMAWILVFNFNEFSSSLPALCLQWIILGGVFYMLGVIFYVWEKVPFNHFIWHLFVFAGSLSHFIAVYYCVI